MFKCSVTLKEDQELNEVITWTQKFAKQLFSWDNMPIPDNHYEYMEAVIEGYDELSDEVKQDLSLKILAVINKSYIFTFKTQRDARLFNARWNENKLSVAEDE